MSVLHPTMTLSERQIANPTIITYGVTLVGDSVFFGTVTLATIGTVSLIGLAIFGVWWGATVIAAKYEGNDKRSLNPSAKFNNKLTKRSGELWTYVDEEIADTQSADNESSMEEEDEVIAEDCVSLIGLANTGGCCEVEYTGEDGYVYVTFLGAAAAESDDTDWGCT